MTRRILLADPEAVGRGLRRAGGLAVTVVLTAALLAWTLRGRGLRDAVTVAAFLLCANVTTQVLKELLATSRDHPYFEDQFPHDTFPSGHATGAMSIALAALLVVPPPRRRLVALVGLAYALLVGTAVVLAGDHFPSDVLGGYAVAGAWAALTAGTLEVSRGSRTRPPGSPDSPDE